MPRIISGREISEIDSDTEAERLLNGDGQVNELTDECRAAMANVRGLLQYIGEDPARE